MADTCPTCKRPWRTGKGDAMAEMVAKGASLAATFHDIVTAMLAAGGHGEEVRRTVAPRVRGNLAYLQRQGKVKKEGEQREAVWKLVD